MAVALRPLAPTQRRRRHAGVGYERPEEKDRFRESLKESRET